MATVLSPPTWETAAQLLHHLGDIPPERVVMRPTPGTAGPDDLAKRTRPCELVDGVLVDKAMGYHESLIAAELIRILGNWVVSRQLGRVSGPDGGMAFGDSEIRLPDVAFISTTRLQVLSDDAYPAIVPELAVEVLSRTNTAAEIRRKLATYFVAGVLMVWVIDRQRRSAKIYTSPTDVTEIDDTGKLTTGEWLADFAVPLADLLRVAE